jgi:acyl-CoA thioesterase FadM
MSRMVETYRGVVAPAAVADLTCQLSDASFGRSFEAATWRFLVQIGLTPQTLRRHAYRAVILEQNSKYQLHLEESDLLEVRTELRCFSTRTLRFRHFLYMSSAEREIATSELLVACLDLETHLSVSLPSEVVLHARELLGYTPSAVHEIVE